MLRVFVALGKQLPKNKAMIEDTESVAKLLAKYNCTMVQGGAKVGLMGTVVEEFQKYSDEIVMIVPEAHKEDLEGTKNKEHYIVESESDRLKITIKTCDLMVVLPGGSGTLTELAFYNETRRSGEHNARIVVVNTKGYYNPLFKFYKHQIKHGLLTENGCKFDVIKSAKDLEPILQQMITEKQATLQQAEIVSEKEEIVAEMVEVTTEAKPVKKVSPKKEKAEKAVKKASKQVAKKAEKTTSKKTEKTTSKKAVKAEPVEEKVEVATEKKTAKANKPASKKSTAKATVKPVKATAKEVKADAKVEKAETKSAKATKATTKAKTTAKKSTKTASKKASK